MSKRIFSLKILFVLACFILLGGWGFQNKSFFISKLKKEEVKAEPSVKGEYDASEVSENTSVLKKYNFPVASYTPIRKPGTLDLRVFRAHASVILDVDSGTILHFENGKEERQIASLTKIMTAVLAVEKIEDLNKEVVTIDEEAVYADGTKIGCPSSGNCIGTRLRVGEKISAMSLFKAMLMNSANDSAIALSKHIGGTQEKFAEMMNDKARELGLKNTNFCTASGLEIEGKEDQCYSSAYDIARVAAYSMRHKIIWDTFKIPEDKIQSLDGKFTHDIMNTNKLLGIMPECMGTKTGFTPLAGKSLMIGAEDSTKKHKIIAVVLDDAYMWEDIREMVYWAFNSHAWQ
ncbi:MAG: hypothetical protein V3574_01305 [Candidatus Moraniibacteriota bacterium]